MYNNFIHLNVKSEYSINYGYIKIKDYINFAIKYKINVLAISESNNLFSALKFNKLCIINGIKPIIGCEIYIELYKLKLIKFLFICKNYLGYINLIKILSKSYSKKNILITKKKNFINLSNHLIVIYLSLNKDFIYFTIQNKIKLLKITILFWNKLFNNNFYISINNIKQSKYNDVLLNIISELKIPLTIIEDIYFLNQDDFKQFEYKTNIYSTKRIKLKKFKNKYIKK